MSFVRAVLAAIVGVGLLSLARPAAAAALEARQVISREDPLFNVADSRMAIGRDGKLYFSGGEYLFRMERDGARRIGSKLTYAMTRAGANADGLIGTSHAHFSHSVRVWQPDFTPIGTVDDFLNSDKVEWFGPCDMQAGEKEFYGLDENRTRIVRVSPAAQIHGTFPLAGIEEDLAGKMARFRVWEAGKRFFVQGTGGKLTAVDFAAARQWSIATKLGSDPWGGYRGGFDVDETGRLHVLEEATGAVEVFSPEGKLEKTVQLDKQSPLTQLQDLALWGDEYYVKRRDPIELCAVFDRATGARRRTLEAQVEVLSLACPEQVWTAGQPLPLEIAFRSSTLREPPRWRVWLRPLGTVKFTELALAGGNLTPPAAAGGLYQLRVTPETGAAAAEYVLDACVEIRRAGSQGTVSLFTPLNRRYYGRGEPIPVSLLMRGAGPDSPRELEMWLTDGVKNIATQRVAVEPGGNALWQIPPELTAQLQPGEFIVTADAPELTVAPQYLEIGPGLAERPKFHIVQHGDYTLSFAEGGWNDLPEKVAAHLGRARRLGVNLFVDRLGSHSGFWTNRPTPPGLTERLTQDAQAVAPEKATLEDNISTCIAACGAYGIEQQGILVGMDGGLPIGTLWDSRKPELFDKALDDVSQHLAAYPAFRGWSWAANWWLEKHGAAAAASAEERAAYEAALAEAQKTGRWSPVLDTVSDRTFAHAVDAERRFRAVLEKAAPGKKSVMTGPYRAIETYPPVIFQNADEVDLHYQAEQIQPPQVTPHEVDYYKRPGKPAWGHPEIWNDDGTGSMALATLLQMVMRGADGVGWSGSAGGLTQVADNPRAGGPGAKSILRSVDALLGIYGPWLTTLENADRLAIVVSPRMVRIETWDGKIGSRYFDALFEAYNSCLYAHRPASFVFPEDLQPDTLRRFKAVLVVGQRVELEPPLAAALAAAAKAGVRIFRDDTCRAELVAGFEPLSVAFDQVSADPSAWQDDSAYERFPRYFRKHAEQLRAVLASAVPPVAETDEPDVLLSERTGTAGRLVWVVNNKIPRWSPGLAWRVGLLMSERLPVVATLRIATRDEIVYDVFADKILSPADEKAGVSASFTVDLSVWPARLLAVLPKQTASASIAALQAMRPTGRTPRPVEALFGLHVKALAVSPDGKTALASTFNFGDNLHAFDLTTGKVAWSKRVGHSFAMSPLAVADGFAATGFDVLSAEGYHLYRLDRAGNIARRFALYGLPKRATAWMSGAMLQDPDIASFAAAPDGSWVAAGGDLGIAAWSPGGKPLWSEDTWQTERRRSILLAVDRQTLLAMSGTTVRALASSDGKLRWELRLAETGSLLGGAVSADGRTVALRADTLGGRVFVVRDGKLVGTLPTAADALVLSPDNQHLAVTTGSTLKWYALDDGLVWTFNGDDVLRNPTISADGRRIAVGSDLGTLTVLGSDGAPVWQRDCGALPVAAFLPDGGLLLADWMGRAERLDASFATLWQTTLRLRPGDIAGQLAAPDATATVRKTGWGNAAAELAPLDENLLRQIPVTLETASIPAAHGDPKPLKNAALLFDGRPDPPAEPWLEWTDINYIDSGWRGPLSLGISTLHTQLRVQGLTLVEDARHPESWLRDVRLQWWDAEADQWRDGPYLLSDKAAHTHWFDKPLEAAKFRFVSTGGGSWPAGNVRLGELVLHGELLGASHRDAIARRPAAVLFDERESDLASMAPPVQYRNDDAASGNKSIWLPAPGSTGPAYRQPGGHALPNWDFEIAEKPGPGQYRWLQFAWKAGAADTTGMALQIGAPFPGGGYTFSAGKCNAQEGTLVERHVSDTVPQTWQTVRADLWELFHKSPLRIQCLRLIAAGGGAQFDQIVLGQSEADLPSPLP